jgi:anhydro-N-acetylmuramic acid kinase
MLAAKLGKAYDEGGKIAESGDIDFDLFHRLNALEYYRQAYPKSLANDFGTDVVYPIIKSNGGMTENALRTYVEHICVQIRDAVEMLLPRLNSNDNNYKLLATGGGALNNFMVDRLREVLQPLNVTIMIPDENLVQYKEALVMALIGVLRWREESNVLASVTGAARNSIGGAVWVGQEA